MGENRWKWPKNISVVHLGFWVPPGCLPMHREHLFSTIRYLNSAPTYQLAYWSYFPPNSSTAIGTLLMCGNLILHMCTIKCPNSGQPQTHISQSQTSITDQMSAMMTINAMASEHWPELRDEMTLTLTYDPVMHDHSTQPVTSSGTPCARSWLHPL